VAAGLSKQTVNAFGIRANDSRLPLSLGLADARPRSSGRRDVALAECPARKRAGPAPVPNPRTMASKPHAKRPLRGPHRPVTPQPRTARRCRCARRSWRTLSAPLLSAHNPRHRSPRRIERAGCQQVITRTSDAVSSGLGRRKRRLSPPLVTMRSNALVLRKCLRTAADGYEPINTVHI